MSTTISSNMTPQQIQQSREDATRQYSQNEAAYRLAQNHRSEYTPESWAEYEKNYKDYEKNYQGFISGSLDVLKASYKEPSTPTIKTETKISGPELTRRMEQIFTSETNKEPTSHVQGEAGFTVAAKGSEEAIKAPKYSVTYTANGKTTVKAFQTRQLADEFISSLPSSENKPLDTMKKWMDQQAEESKRLADLIHGDIINEADAKKYIDQLRPLVASSTTPTPDVLGDIWTATQTKLNKLEKEAQWDKARGAYHAVPPEKVSYEVMRARIAHVSLSYAVAGVTALPYAVIGTAGGPVGAGLMAAIMVAGLANSENRAATAEFIRLHPEQFTAGLIGALTAGVSVQAVKGAYTTYKNSLTQQQRWKLETAMDKAIDDLAYKEQQFGATFPSKELPLEYPDWETYIAEKFVIGLEPADIKKWMASQRTSMFLYMDDKMMAVGLKDLVKKYPQLVDPQIQSLTPSEMNALLKKYPDLVSRIQGSKDAAMSPLLIAALAVVARQGYITEDDVKQLIERNSVTLENYNQVYGKLNATWTKEDLAQLSITDLLTLTVPMISQIQLQINHQIQTLDTPQITELIKSLSTTQLADLITSLDTVSLQEITPIITATLTPAELEELKRKLTPIKRRSFNIDNKTIPIRETGKYTYSVKFTDYNGKTEIINIEAQTFREAYIKSRNLRRWHGLPHEVLIQYRGSRPGGKK